jgi:hypothetical protein
LGFLLDSTVGLGHRLKRCRKNSRLSLAPAALLLFAAAVSHAQTPVAVENVLPDAPSVALKSTIAVAENKAGVPKQTEDFQANVEELGLTWTGSGSQTSQGKRVWKPLSMGEKFQLFVGNTYSSSTLTALAISAHTPSILSSADEQHRNLGRRYAAAYADAQSNAFFEDFLIPALTHQDPVYHRQALGTIGGRVNYAMTRVFIARKDDGENTFNSSSMAGAFVASAVHNAYHPYNNASADGTVNRALGRLATRMGMNVVREFWPDVRRHFHGRVGAMMEAYKP